jgi:molybdopterin converting factor subunit 1
MLTIQVQYFAILREQRGVAQEKLSTTAATPGELYDELRSRYNFTLPANRIRAAVNDAFVDAATPLANGDRIVFIPPVAGG